MKQTNRKITNWWVDILLLIGFLLMFKLEFTGLAFHEWAGLAVGAAALFHILLHSKWIRSVSERFFGKLPGRVRLYFVVDALLLLGFFTILFTGLVISDLLNLPLDNYFAWRSVHVVGSFITLIALALKLALHWQWIVNTARRCVFKFAPDEAVCSREVQAVDVKRREFLRFVGISSAALVLTAGGLIKKNASGSGAGEELTAGDALSLDPTASAAPTSAGTVQVEAPTAVAPTAQAELDSPTAVPATATSVPVVPTAAANSGTVRCTRGCSYPGHCRRYTDSNGNNRCDLSEW